MKTLYLREVKRFSKVYIQTIFVPVITTLIFLAIFTLAIGSFRGDINGIPFIEFLAPGLIMMAILQNSFANTTSSIMSAKMQGNIIDTLMPPLTPGETISAYIIGGATRGIAVGIAVTFAMFFFTHIEIKNIYLILFHTISASSMMASIGFIGGIWAEKHEQNTIITGFIVTPLSFLSGTFYSINKLPELLQLSALFNPFFYSIDGFRAGFIGISDGPIYQGIIVMCLINILLWVFCHFLYSSGYKLKA
ncbi:MAG: multidrug ABC transporter permease [Rhodospirillaceae bacterium]|nr:multidrug ABC transporter permease [Rhodospirillaceae bacterium]OUT80726.1 MAG: multidrug ABC transporter permease [Rhodospirillaceae bacterium TMED23]|tara:strand:+ start:2342 stop:3088 length:747 start_codon:yes stop_codon:yes gene_type:complete